MASWIVFLIVAGLVQFAGLALVIAGFRRAPEAFEDEDGFHFGREPIRVREADKSSGNAA